MNLLKNVLIIPCLIVGLGGGLISCKKAGQVSTDTLSEGPSGYPFSITATTGMISNITKEIVGDSTRAIVTGLIGEGIDPHLYKPTRSDLVALRGADLIIYNGLKLEGKLEGVLMKIAESGKPVIAVTESLASHPEYLLNTGDHADPHVWMDVSGWMRAVEVVMDALSKFDVQNAASYRQNAEAYLLQLRGLHGYAQETLASIPESQRVLVTAHDAFGYLGKAYGVEVMGIQGISTESEAGVKDIESLVDFLVSKKIPAVFVESSVSDKNVQALIEGARSQGHEIMIGGELFSDAMGAAGTYEGTYIGMIDHNITTIAQALGGQAPQGGFRGKLNHK